MATKERTVKLPSMRVPSGLRRRADALRAMFGVKVTRATVLRRAIELGLEAMEAERKKP